MRELKKVSLDVGERFAVLQLLPEKAGFTNMKLIRDLRDALILTPEEEEAVGFVQNGDQLKWEADKVEENVADIPFDPKTFVMVMVALEKLDKEEALESRHTTLYEKFVLPGGAETVEVEKVVGAV